MITANFHNVTRVELCSSHPANSNSRTIRIEISNHEGLQCVEITLFGETDALDALPKSADFRVCVSGSRDFDEAVTAVTFQRALTKEEYDALVSSLNLPWSPLSKAEAAE